MVKDLSVISYTNTPLPYLPTLPTCVYMYTIFTFTQFFYKKFWFLAEHNIFEVCTTLDVFFVFFMIFWITFLVSDYSRGFENADDSQKSVKNSTVFWQIFGRFQLFWNLYYSMNVKKLFKKSLKIVETHQKMSSSAQD